VVKINVTFGTNENKVSFVFVYLVRVSKPENPMKHDEICLKTCCNMFEIVETCSNMVMFILVFIVYNDDVWWLKEWMFNYVITFRNKQKDMSKWMDAINRKMQESKPDWKSNAFIVDDVDAKINSLRLKCVIFL
jgi:hypothetical protein